MTSCRKYQKLIDQAVDFPADALADGRLQAHLRECPACREYLAQLRALKAGIAQMPVPEAPLNLNDRLHTAFTQRRETRVFGWKKISALACGAMALCLVGFIGIKALQGGGPMEADLAPPAPGAAMDKLLMVEAEAPMTLYSDAETPEAAADTDMPDMTEDNGAYAPEPREGEQLTVEEAPQYVLNSAGILKDETTTADSGARSEAGGKKAADIVEPEEAQPAGNNKLAALLLGGVAILLVTVGILCSIRLARSARRRP